MPAGNRVELPGGRVIYLPWLHFGVMGKPGSGKTRLIASMPKPLLVLATDPVTKMGPYFDCGIVDDEETVGPFGQTIYVVRDKPGGKVIVQVECFADCDPQMTTSAFSGINNRLPSAVQQARDGQIASFGLDSWSGLEDFARHRRLAGPLAIKNPDGRAHHNVAKEDCKQLFVMSLIHMKCNVGIAFHISERQIEGGGEMLYNMKCIGDFASTVGQNLGEVYRSVSQPDGVTRLLYTRPDGRFELQTRIEAPNPCENKFPALFSNMIAKKIAQLDAAEKETKEGETK